MILHEVTVRCGMDGFKEINYYYCWYYHEAF